MTAWELSFYRYILDRLPPRNRPSRGTQRRRPWKPNVHDLEADHWFTPSRWFSGATWFTYGTNDLCFLCRVSVCPTGRKHLRLYCVACRWKHIIEHFRSKPFFCMLIIDRRKIFLFFGAAVSRSKLSESRLCRKNR